MRLRDRVLGSTERRSVTPADFYGDAYSVGGNFYPMTTYPTAKDEPLPNDFIGYAGVMKSNPVVFACLSTRLALVTEARFAFRRYRKGRPGDLFGTEALGILERPDRNITTGGLLGRMEQDGSLAGNAFNARVDDRIIRLKPQFTTIVLGTPNAGVENPSDDPEVEVLGYLYDAKRGDPPRVFFPDEVSHFAPIKDPLANFRGMSWLTPVLREVEADDKATGFKAQFYKQGASPNMVITLDKDIGIDKFKEFKAAFDEEHTGLANFFKTVFLGGGADAKVVGSNFKDMAYTAVQEAGENRVCMAAGVPAIMVGAKSGLDSSTYSNTQQARRLLADGFGRPWWREASASLEPLIDVPSDARLDVDVDDIAFLRDDGKDIAEIQLGQAGAIKALTEAGFEPDSVVDAVTANDMARLKGNHTGKTSVQLQEPADGGSPTADSDDDPDDPDRSQRPLRVPNEAEIDPLEAMWDRVGYRALPAAAN